MSRKMMLVTFMVLPFLAARPVLAQDTLKLDLGLARRHGHVEYGRGLRGRT